MTRALLPLAALLLAGCAAVDPAPSPQDRFFARLSALCGRAFEGRIVSPPVAADAAFADKRLIMHVRDCSDAEIHIPFQVGDDRSRTWVVARSGDSLRLKHAHRHADGSADALSQYGGDARAPGSADRQEFPADPFSRALFERHNIPQSATNVWAIELAPAFAYELRRPGRFFRIEFDLARPVAPPPPPWGRP